MEAPPPLTSLELDVLSTELAAVAAASGRLSFRRRRRHRRHETKSFVAQRTLAGCYYS